LQILLALFRFLTQRVEKLKKILKKQTNLSVDAHISTSAASSAHFGPSDALFPNAAQEPSSSTVLSPQEREIMADITLDPDDPEPSNAASAAATGAWAWAALASEPADDDASLHAPTTKILEQPEQQPTQVCVSCKTSPFSRPPLLTSSALLFPTQTSKVKIAVRDSRPRCCCRRYGITTLCCSCSNCRPSWRCVNVGVYLSFAVCSTTRIGTNYGGTTITITIIASNRQGQITGRCPRAGPLERLGCPRACCRE